MFAVGGYSLRGVKPGFWVSSGRQLTRQSASAGSVWDGKSRVKVMTVAFNREKDCYGHDLVLFQVSFFLRDPSDTWILGPLQEDAAMGSSDSADYEYYKHASNRKGRFKPYTNILEGDKERWWQGNSD